MSATRTRHLTSSAIARTLSALLPLGALACGGPAEPASSPVGASEVPAVSDTSSASATPESPQVEAAAPVTTEESAPTEGNALATESEPPAPETAQPAAAAPPPPKAAAKPAAKKKSAKGACGAGTCG